SLGVYLGAVKVANVPVTRETLSHLRTRTSTVPYVFGRELSTVQVRHCKVRRQRFSSDAHFTPTDIFKQTILTTAFIKTLEIFPSAIESLSIQSSTSGSLRNQ